jgi:cell filamentation protein, protein adenylyltransferase
VETQAKAAVDDAERLLNLQSRYHDSLTTAKARQAAHQLIDRLFINPYISAPRAAEALGVSAPTARAAIRDLTAQGILRELTGRKWGQLFLADEVLQAVRGGVESD